MAQRQRVFVPLPEDLDSVPRIHVPVTPLPSEQRRVGLEDKIVNAQHIKLRNKSKAASKTKTRGWGDGSDVTKQLAHKGEGQSFPRNPHKILSGHGCLPITSA